MKIVSITEITKTRLRISLETEESFVLYKGDVRILKLKENTELSDEQYATIMNGILPKRCKMRAMNLLKDRNYTSYGLKKKLLDGGYPERICDDTLSYVISYGYINDLQYAIDYIKSRENSHSVREIKQKLQMRGITQNDISRAFLQLGTEREEFGESSSGELEEMLIRKTLEKRHFSSDTDYEEKQKLLAYFYRRGFGVDRVRRVMDTYCER